MKKYIFTLLLFFSLIYFNSNPISINPYNPSQKSTIKTLPAPKWWQSNLDNSSKLI